MAYPVKLDQESITRVRKIFSDTRKGTCWTCNKMVNYGVDDATGKPIAFCGPKNQIVAPERGCEFYDHT